MIARNANINQVNSNKETPLFIATKANKPNNIAVILEEDEEALNYKDVSGNYAVHIAARNGYTDCIKAMSKFDKNIINAQGGPNKMTPLMYAAAYGHFGTVSYLVESPRISVNLE